MQVQLDEGIILNLPPEGEKIGIDEFKVIGKLIGRTAGKIRKWGKDGKFQFRERFSALLFAVSVANRGRGINWKNLYWEWRDLDALESGTIAEIVKKEYADVTGETLKSDPMDLVQTLLDGFMTIQDVASGDVAEKPAWADLLLF